MTEAPSCVLKRLPDHLAEHAAEQAVMINPLNHPLVGPDSGPLQRSLDGPASPQRISFLTTKYWRTEGGVHLTVGFLDGGGADLQARIISHMNAWGKTAAVKFVASSTDPQVRIARVPGDGYWSYLGTDILSVPTAQPTMNFDSFTMQTPESEYQRVVPHEAGHSLGAPHEHMRAEIVAGINRHKAIVYFMATQGWSRRDVIAQVLTPISEDSFVIASPHAQRDSIMCYELPGKIMKDGKPVIGGSQITEDDYAYIGKLYPIQVA